MTQNPKNYRDFIKLEKEKQEREEFYCQTCFRLKVLCNCQPRPKKSKDVDEKK